MVVVALPPALLLYKDEKQVVRDAERLRKGEARETAAKPKACMPRSFETQPRASRMHVCGCTV